MEKVYEMGAREGSGQRAYLILLHGLAYGIFWLLAEGRVSWELVAFGVILIWISIVDWECYEIPDAASGLLALSGAIWIVTYPDVVLLDHVAGAIFWPLMFFGVGYFFRELRGYDGLGLGDVKLMVGVGLWVGFLNAIFVVLGAALAGIATLLAFRLVGRQSDGPLEGSPVAFGPFLCLSTWVVWLSGSYSG